MAVFKPTQSNDDCYVISTTINLDDPSVVIGNYGGPVDAGFRFTNVTIPQGSTILTAKEKANLCQRA